MRVLWLALLLLPLASAQGHEHGMGSGYAVVSDLGHDGRAFVGSPNHFDLIAFGDDMIPDFHQNLPVRVTLDNFTIYETTTSSGHDYDGVHGFDIVFPRAGHWKVAALADGAEVAWLEGEAVELPLRDAEIIHSMDATGFMVDVVDSAGNRINHTDVLVEFFDDDGVLLRFKQHIHNQPAQTQFWWPDGATGYTLTAFTAAPEQGPGIRPTTADFVAAITPPRNQMELTAPATPPSSARNQVTTSQSDMLLVGTYDPYTSVGPDTLVRLQAMVVSDVVERHMTYSVVATGPRGQILATSDAAGYDGKFHEHDGILEIASRQETPGEYRYAITAQRGDWSDTITMSYYVLPPVMATIAGPQFVTMATELKAAPNSSSINFIITDAAERPFAHGEIDLQIRGAGLTVLRDKLHTHADGTFPFTYALPHGGTFDITLDPFPLDPQPVGQFYGSGLGDALDFFVVVGGESPRWMQSDFGHADNGGQMAVDPAAEQAPGLPIALVIIALALLATRKS